MGTAISEDQLYALRFPVGEFKVPKHISKEQLQEWIADIRNFSSEVRTLVEELSDAQLDLTYRPGGWTIRQVVHHCADSHMNSVARFKLALTENHPTIRPYNESAWAELSDSLGPVEMALDLLESLHCRWVYLLDRLTDEELTKTFYHPANDVSTTLAETIGTYAWHCRHHLGHVRLALSVG